MLTMKTMPNSGRKTLSTWPTLDERQFPFVQLWMKDSSFLPNFPCRIYPKHVWLSAHHSDDSLCPYPSFSSWIPHSRMYFAWFDRSVIIIVELGQSYHHEDHPDQMLGILEGCLKCQYLRLAASTSYKCIHTALTSRWNIILTLQLHTSWWK